MRPYGKAGDKARGILFAIVQIYITFMRIIVNKIDESSNYAMAFTLLLFLGICAIIATIQIILSYIMIVHEFDHSRQSVVE